MLSEAQILERLRKICRDLVEATETVTFGHPTFQVNGKNVQCARRIQKRVRNQREG